jgi:hypothetical protein
VFRKDDLAVNSDIENAAIAARHFGIDPQFILDCGCQTGSPRQVASTLAIRNRYSHGYLGVRSPALKTS